ncbi:hypothetical protein RJ639_023819 [Escallonia herrerae]|uniref:Cytochrome P450 n=1 Tax=Escallonia herrerae TaxID=1293975 RepID=A0AA88V0D4_9ASTE|nr:hypothetical protein RJ639_023819 [Escallonia herrerae]
MVLEYFPSFAILLASLQFMYIVVKQWKGSKSALPPGPKGLPLIGNIYHLIGSSLPHHALRDLAKKYGPVMHLRLGELTTIIISSPEAAEAALKTHELSLAQRPILHAVKAMSSGGFGVIFAPYGNYWRQMRKICTLELLSAKRVRSFRPVREEEVTKFIESIHCSSSNGDSAINLTDKIFKLTNCITSRAMFGKECKEGNEFVMAVKGASELAGGFDISELFPSLKILHFFSSKKSTLENLHLRLDKLLDNVIDDHKAKRALNHDMSGHEEEDLVDMLLNLTDSTHLEFPFTTTDIKAIILDIFGAGTDTSATTTAWAMAELMKNPKVMEKAQVEVRQCFRGTKKINEEDIQELKYLKYVIKETLRLHPPAPLIPRESMENFQMGKYKIPAKARLMFNLWAIARDAKHWPDADCFRPERFHESCIDYKGTNFKYLPFGAGRRMCPGIAFGIANVELPLAQLLYHFDWKLPRGMKPEELSMTEGFGVSVNRKDPLYLIATPVCSTE